MDRISKLEDRTLGHILSFLDAQEAGRTAMLSSRWRNIFPYIHTINMHQKTVLDSDLVYNGNHVDHGDSDGNNGIDYMADCPSDGNGTASMADWASGGNGTASMADWASGGNGTASMADWASGGNRTASMADGDLESYTASINFSYLVTRALLRQVRGGLVQPLRALRVCLQSYCHSMRSTVDHWVFSLVGCVPPNSPSNLEVSLFLSHVPHCKRLYMYNQSLPSTQQSLEPQHLDEKIEDAAPKHPEDDSGSSSSSSSDNIVPPPPMYDPPMLLLCSHLLQTLRLGTVKLRVPANVSLPALETLHLSQVPDAEEDVQRLLLACPKLLDLTLEGCPMVSTLSLLGNTRLHKIAFSCCSKLSVVYVSTSRIQWFQYRGDIPASSLFAAQDGGFQSITTCTIDVCGGCFLEGDNAQAVTARTTDFALQFVTTKRLKLCSPNMASAFQAIPAFSTLRHLWLSGRVTSATVADVISILNQTPSLEMLTLSLGVVPPSDFHDKDRDTYDSLDRMLIPTCLRDRVRTINLLNLQGTKAQAALVKYLLRSTLKLTMLYCLFEALRQEMMEEEMKRWIVSKEAAREFQPPWFWERVEGEEGHEVFRQGQVTKAFEHGW